MSKDDLQRLTKYVDEVISRSWGNARLWGTQMEREIGATERKPVIKAVLLILLGILISSFCFKLIFVNHMEEKITSIPMQKRDSVSIQDYATTYDAISGATGNYISGVVAALTLVLLGLQYHEMKESRKRYNKDKMLEKLNREKDEVLKFAGMIDAKLSSLTIGTEGKSGTEAILKASQLMISAIDERKKYLSGIPGVMVFGEKVKFFNSEMRSVVELSIYLLKRAKSYEIESLEFLDAAFFISVEYKYIVFVNRLRVYLKLKAIDEDERMFNSLVAEYLCLRHQFTRQKREKVKAKEFELIALQLSTSCK